jgi:hypothetical protein
MSSESTGRLAPIFSKQDYKMKRYFLISAAVLTVLVSPAIAQDEAAMPSVEQIMGFLDANKDGFIEKSEAQGPMVEYFDMIDGDKDAKISSAELKTAMDMRAKAMSKGAEAAANETAK